MWQRAGNGNGGGGVSGNFNVAHGNQWNGVTLGFHPTKLYICMIFGTSGAGCCIYDEEQNVSKYCYKGSAFYDRTFSDCCHITSTGFEIKNEFSSVDMTAYYLAEG